MKTREGLAVPRSVADIVGKQFGRIAIANPAHAPYGIAAREALIRAGVFDAVEQRLIFGENVSDTLRLVETGNVDIAIVALSLVITGSLPYQLIDDTLHQPLKQSLVVTKTGANQKDAEKFVAFLSSAEGRTTMNSYGFSLPNEGM